MSSIQSLPVTNSTEHINPLEALNSQDAKDSLKQTTDKSDKIINFNQFIESQTIFTAPKKLSTYIVKKLDRVDHFLDTNIPNNSVQNKIDSALGFIQKTFAPLAKFSKWLDDNGHGNFYSQLAIFVAKLPPRVIRNVVRLLFDIVKGCINTVTHPLKTINNLAKLIVQLIAEFTKPETWSKTGIAMISSSIGQSLITGNPLSIFGVGIGAAMLIGGLSSGALFSALKAQSGHSKDAVLKHLTFQATQLPEAMLTGLCMGLLMGSIQHALHKHHVHHHRIRDFDEAKVHADKFVHEQNLPEFSELKIDEAGRIIMTWEGEDLLLNFREARPHLIDYKFSFNERAYQCSIILDKQLENCEVVTSGYGWDGMNYEFVHNETFDNLGFSGDFYPTAHPSTALNNIGPLSGAAATLTK